MIFTLGHTESYERYFVEQGTPQKMGSEDPTRVPGSVWRTREEAEEVRPQGYSVYGVLADWETGTVPVPISTHRNLLVSSDLVKLAEVMT
jgi:hypothetical protein